MSSSSSSEFDDRPIKVIIKKKKKVVIREEIEPNKDNRYCNVENCKEKKHGRFDECKDHFMKRHRKGSNFKWSPPEVGYKTIMDILKCYSHVYSFDEISEEDIENGKDSKIPISCIMCNHHWKPSINSLLKGHGCPDCSGNSPWTLERFQRVMSHNPNIDISEIKREHIKGDKSRVFVSCKKCNHRWNTDIDHLTHHKRGCPECAQNIRWDLTRLLMRLKNRLDIDLSLLREEDIVNSSSKIPILCNYCSHKWYPSIGHLVNSNSGCPKCCGKIRYNLIILQEKLKNRNDIDISHVEEKHIKGTKSHIPIKCRKCNHKWNPTITNLVNSKSGCPICNSSKAIMYIIGHLNKLNIIHKLEKTFVGMLDKSRLRIDIYIPEIEGIKYPIFIEYDGNYPGSHFSYQTDEEKKTHILTVKRDKIKDKYAKDNKMHMIRIPYTCFPNNSEEKLKETLEEALEILKTKKKPFLCLMDEELYKRRDENLLEE